MSIQEKKMESSDSTVELIEIQPSEVQKEIRPRVRRRPRKRIPVIVPPTDDDDSDKENVDPNPPKKRNRNGYSYVANQLEEDENNRWWGETKGVNYVLDSIAKVREEEYTGTFDLKKLKLTNDSVPDVEQVPGWTVVYALPVEVRSLLWFTSNVVRQLLNTPRMYSKRQSVEEFVDSMITLANYVHTIKHPSFNETITDVD